MSQELVDLARRGYEAVRSGDFDTVREFLDPDVKWHGGSPADGCRNRKQALEWMRGARERGPRSRRAIVGVEVVEPRISLSGFTGQATGVIHGYEVPNQRSTSLVRQFNPQPALPTALTRIIAI